jgi:hypothetical protein
MTRSRPFDELLESWLDEGPVMAPEDLLESAFDIPVTYRQRHRFLAVRRLTMVTRSVRFVGAAAAAAVVVVGIVGIALFGRGSPFAGGLATASPTATVTETDVPSASPVASPTPVGSPVAGLCDPANLAARITLWEGAAGHRIATIELMNAGSSECSLNALDRPQLVDGNGAVLIDGEQPAESAVLSVGPGDTLTTLVQDGNYCGPTPIAPVTVAFVLPDGVGRFVASPTSPTDVSGVPPCNSTSGSAGSIEMHPWAP